jgi:hypothetical protein
MEDEYYIKVVVDNDNYITSELLLNEKYNLNNTYFVKIKYNNNNKKYITNIINETDYSDFHSPNVGGKKKTRKTIKKQKKKNRRTTTKKHKKKK